MVEDKRVVSQESAAAYATRQFVRLYNGHVLIKQYF
jgi:hypothetical protein